MISFALTERDREILEEARAQAELAVKYARDFEHDEDRMLPPEFPEAEGRPDVRELMDRHVDELSGRKIIHALLYLEDWRGGVPLRESRYSLGNTVLAIAGTPEQYARWADKTIAIGLTEPIGGSDPASTRTTATWDAATNQWIVEGEKIFITYAQSCDAVLVLARLIHPDGRRGLSTFMIEKGTPGFSVGKQIPQDGHPFRGHGRAVVLRLPHLRLQPHRRRPEEDASIIQRVAARRRGLCLRRFARRDGFHLGAARRNRRDAGLDAGPTGMTAAADRMLELEAEWEATWVAVVRAKWVEQNEGPGKIESSIAKVMGGGLARKATQTCIAILGACGLSAEHLSEKWFRDARIFDIYEGTGEIQRLILARDLLGYSPKELN